eukprot:scaffold557_cov89-Skeletonema_dohrnii-CCMP3373.AAC.3
MDVECALRLQGVMMLVSGERNRAECRVASCCNHHLRGLIVVVSTAAWCARTTSFGKVFYADHSCS